LLVSFFFNARAAVVANQYGNIKDNEVVECEYVADISILILPVAVAN